VHIKELGSDHTPAVGEELGSDPMKNPMKNCNSPAVGEELGSDAMKICNSSLIVQSRS
jgi:hypothetical protein